MREEIIDKIVDFVIDSFDWSGFIASYDSDAFEVFVKEVLGKDVENTEEELEAFILFNSKVEEVRDFLIRPTNLPKELYIEELKKLYRN